MILNIIPRESASVQSFEIDSEVLQMINSWPFSGGSRCLLGCDSGQKPDLPGNVQYPLTGGRVGIAHYNTLQEVDRTLKAIADRGISGPGADGHRVGLSS